MTDRNIPRPLPETRSPAAVLRTSLPKDIHGLFFHPRIGLFLIAFACGCGNSSTAPAPPGPSPMRNQEGITAQPAYPSPALISTGSQTPAPSGWCSPPGRLKSGFLVIGYLPDYRNLEPEWGNCLTDLIYFSAEPRSDGTLDTSLVNPLTIARMREMKSRYGIRLHFSVGGYRRSENFSAVVTNPQRRQTLIDDLLRFAESNALDGIDFDWEFPENPAEVDGYLSLMKSVRRAGLIVSAAIFPDPGLDLSPYREIDRIHIMSYDHAPRHSTFEQSIADLEVFLRAGFSRRQLILGIPFYGRQTVSPFASLPYSEIIKKYSPPPEVDEVDGFYFNGISTVRRKVCYALENGYGGIMMWELGQDSAGESSLLKAAYFPLANGCLP
jgi:chitinase